MIDSTNSPNLTFIVSLIGRPACESNKMSGVTQHWPNVSFA